MKLEGFTYIPKLRLSLTRAEVESLVKNSARHYDYECRKSGIEGAVGTLRNRLDLFGGDAVEDTLEFRDVDIMAKIVERDDPELSGELIKALQAANAEYYRLNQREQKM